MRHVKPPLPTPHIYVYLITVAILICRLYIMSNQRVSKVKRNTAHLHTYEFQPLIWWYDNYIYVFLNKNV